MSIAGLYGRQANRIIAEAAAAGKGLTPVGSGKTVTFPLNGATAVVVQVTFSSRPYTALVPVAWMTETSQTFAIAVYQNNILISCKNDGGTCTISHGSYTLTCYTLGAVGAGGGGGGSSDIVTWASIIGKPDTFPPSEHTHQDTDIMMTDYPGSLQEAFAFAETAMTDMGNNLFSLAGSVEDLGIVVAQKVTDADWNGKTYGRKDGAWVEIGTGGNIHMSVSGDTLIIDSDTSVTVSGDTLVINT